METEAYRETLVAALRERGIAYLAPSDASANDAPALAASELIARLATQDDARLVLSLIPLFILHPECASEVPQVAAVLNDQPRIALIACYMAAVYLQRLWGVRLGFYMQAVPPPARLVF